MSVKQFKMSVPTYNAYYFHKEVEANQMEEYGDPEVPVLIHEAGGVRIVLGTHDFDDMDKPDIQIERHPKGWMIFLHPLGGSDACAYVYFLDDGRSFLRHEHPYGPTPALEILETDEELEEINGLNDETAASENTIAPDEPAHLPTPSATPTARASWLR